MSRKFWLIAVLTVVLLSALAIQPAQAVSQQLVMFRGDLQHTGVYAAAGPQAAPEVVWKIQTGGKVVTSPAIAGSQLFFGSYDGNLYAVNKVTGDVLWKFKTQDQVKSSPAILNNTVFFAGKDGYFYALNIKNGKLRWKFQTQDANTAYYEKGIPWFTEGIDPMFYEWTGEKRFDRINDPWDCFYSSPAVYEDAVYFGAYDGSVYALNSDTGALKWRFQTGGPVRSSPAIANGVLFIGGFDGNLYAIDIKTGREKWSTSYIPGEWNTVHFQSSPAVVNGMVYIGGRDTYLQAFDAQTGARIWQYSHNGSWVISSPAVFKGVVYAGSSDGLFVQAVDTQTGEQRWSFPTLHNVFASPTIAGDTLYVGDYNGYALADASLMYALDVKTGAEKWHFATNGSVSSPVVDNGILYFGTEDGYMLALK